MPPFIAIAIAGVGIYTGLKWFARGLQRSASEHGGGEHGASASETSGGARHDLKDLGTLDWDAATGVYKPRKETAG